MVHLSGYFHVYASFRQHLVKKWTFFAEAYFLLKHKQISSSAAHDISLVVLRLIRPLKPTCDWDSYCWSQRGQQTDNLRRIASRACTKRYLSLQARSQKADRLHLCSRLLPLDCRCVRDCASDRLSQSVPPSIRTVESIKNLIFRVYWALNGSAEIAMPVKRLVALLTRPPLQGRPNRKCTGLKSLRACAKPPLWPSDGNSD